MVNLIISHQIFPSLLLGFVQKIEETIPAGSSQQMGVDCWIQSTMDFVYMFNAFIQFPISGYVEDMFCY